MFIAGSSSNMTIHAVKACDIVHPISDIQWGSGSTWVYNRTPSINLRFLDILLKVDV